MGNHGKLEVGPGDLPSLQQGTPSIIPQHASDLMLFPKHTITKNTSALTVHTTTCPHHSPSRCCLARHRDDHGSHPAARQRQSLVSPSTPQHSVTQHHTHTERERRDANHITPYPAHPAPAPAQYTTISRPPPANLLVLWRLCMAENPNPSPSPFECQMRPPLLLYSGLEHPLSDTMLIVKQGLL